MSDRLLSDHIKDPELQRIAKAHRLDNWHWGEEGELTALAMMEGAAIAIRCIYDEGRDIEVYVHQSGIMQIWGGAYFHYDISPSDEVEVEKDWRGGNALDWEGDPVVKKYEHKNRLTLCWDESGEMFPEEEDERFPDEILPPD